MVGDAGHHAHVAVVTPQHVAGHHLGAPERAQADEPLGHPPVPDVAHPDDDLLAHVAALGRTDGAPFDACLWGDRLRPHVDTEARPTSQHAPVLPRLVARRHAAVGDESRPGNPAMVVRHVDIDARAAKFVRDGDRRGDAAHVGGDVVVLEVGQQLRIEPQHPRHGLAMHRQARQGAGGIAHDHVLHDDEQLELRRDVGERHVRDIDEHLVVVDQHDHVGHHASLRRQVACIGPHAGSQGGDVVGQQALQPRRPIGTGHDEAPRSRVRSNTRVWEASGMAAMVMATSLGGCAPEAAACTLPA